MNAQNTIESLKKFCTQSSNDPLGQIWKGKSGTYYWNIGRATSDGIINGVVRKLAGIDVSGHQIWVVAGSLKIMPDGSIVRFTGLSKKEWKLVESMAQQPVLETV
jgi:hypothetical protein